MEDRRVLIDTSILIDYFRKKNKEKTVLYCLTKRHDRLAMSVITKFEFLIGFGDQDLEFAQRLLQNIETFDIDSKCVMKAREIYRDLKSRNKLIGVPDILLASTAVVHGFQLATLNTKHFQLVRELKIFKLNGEK